jgi:hypothetical protein
MRRGHYTPPEPPKKPRLARIVNPDELAELLRHTAELGYPQLQSDNAREFWCDADELRAWREARSTHTSPGNQE